MSVTVKQQLINKKKPLGISKNCAINSIEISPEKQSTLLLNNGESLTTTCLHCPDQPCIKYSIEETRNDVLNKFRIDSSTQTCAIDAIHWDYESSIPVIDNERCVLCGVCASRCPAQAIYLTSEGARVSASESTTSVFSSEEYPDILSHTNTRSLLNVVSITGQRLLETEMLCLSILKRIREYKGKVTGLLPNILARNILRSFKIAAVSYGQGVQYNTVDVLSFSEEFFGVIEVELSPAIIDTPRNLAAYIAILSARYNLKQENIHPLL